MVDFLGYKSVNWLWILVVSVHDIHFFNKEGFKMKKNHVLVFTFFLVFSLFFLACINPAGLVSYPHTDYDIDFMGIKSGLTSSSSDQAFITALNEITQTYYANNPSSSDELVFDGVTYEFANVQVTTGGVPNIVWEHYWEKLKTYTYHVGSCFVFVHVEIPVKGSTGTIYLLYTIIRSTITDGDVFYIAYKGSLSPKT